jgi:ubiquinone/menaquinone biosynthesis C-methylase UbiE
MWIWIFSIISIIIRIILFTIGLRRVQSERVIGPEEGIEDEATVRSYEKVSRMLPFKILRMLAIRRLKKMQPQGLMADIGCGPGYFTAEMTRAVSGVNVIAVDIADEMLVRAKKNLSSPDIADRISYKQGDIHELPFDGNALDFVVSTFSLHHWADPPVAFREIHRVLKPRGQFLVYDTRRDSPWLYYQVLKLAQKFILPSQLNEKNEPTSSVKASYTPEEATSFFDDIPFSELSVKPGFFWLFVSGRKAD